MGIGLTIFAFTLQIRKSQIASTVDTAKYVLDDLARQGIDTPSNETIPNESVTGAVVGFPLVKLPGRGPREPAEGPRRENKTKNPILIDRSRLCVRKDVCSYFCAQMHSTEEATAHVALCAPMIRDVSGGACRGCHVSPASQAQRSLLSYLTACLCSSHHNGGPFSTDVFRRSSPAANPSRITSHLAIFPASVPNSPQAILLPVNTRYLA